MQQWCLRVLAQDSVDQSARRDSELGCSWCGTRGRTEGLRKRKNALK